MGKARTKKVLDDALEASLDDDEDDADDGATSEEIEKARAEETSGAWPTSSQADDHRRGDRPPGAPLGDPRDDRDQRPR